MIFKQFIKLPGSIFGQMALLTVLFIVICIYYFIVSPVFKHDVRFEPLSDLETTVTDVRLALRVFIDKQLNTDDTIKPIEAYDEIKAVKASNPNFRYYVSVAGKTFNTPGYQTQYYDQTGLAGLDKVNREMELKDLCSTAFKTINNAQEGNGYVQYNYCNGSSFYLEFSGIRVPIKADYPGFLDVYIKVFLSNSGRFLYSAGGVFPIVSLILVLNLRLIKKLADVAKSFNPETLDRKLPEQGLPKEVLPLVKAVNQMIAKVDATHKKHNFFLSTAAHEMRTPLTVLRTRLELMDEGKLKDELISDVRRLINLVNQLLKLMQAGGPKTLDNSVDLVECCEHVLLAQAAHAAQTGVTLAFDNQAEHYLMQGDSGLLEVAITNLVGNAISFSDKGQIVQLTLTPDGQLSVRDFGPGIPEKNIESLFSPFAKYPPNRNGHGLGLAIVDAIVRLHRGQVSAANADGGGALFLVQLSHQQS